MGCICHSVKANEEKACWRHGRDHVCQEKLWPPVFPVERGHFPWSLPDLVRVHGDFGEWFGSLADDQAASLYCGVRYFPNPATPHRPLS
eukprot:g30614.t1